MVFLAGHHVLAFFGLFAMPPLSGCLRKNQFYGVFLEKFILKSGFYKQKG
jgi:hypothetical protein